MKVHDGFEIKIGKYASNYRPSVSIFKNGEPFMTLSVNDRQIDLDEDEFIVKNYSENAAHYEQFGQYFDDTGLRVVVGFADNCPIWRLKK